MYFIVSVYVIRRRKKFSKIEKRLFKIFKKIILLRIWIHYKLYWHKVRKLRYVKKNLVQIYIIFLPTLVCAMKGGKKNSGTCQSIWKTRKTTKTVELNDTVGWSLWHIWKKPPTSLLGHIFGRMGFRNSHHSVQTYIYWVSIRE